MLILQPKYLSNLSASLYLYPQTAVILHVDYWNKPWADLSTPFLLWSLQFIVHIRTTETTVKQTNKIFHYINIFNAPLLLLRKHLSSLVKICVFWPLANSETLLWALYIPQSIYPSFLSFLQTAMLLLPAHMLLSSLFSVPGKSLLILLSLMQMPLLKTRSGLPATCSNSSPSF